MNKTIRCGLLLLPLCLVPFHPVVAEPGSASLPAQCSGDLRDGRPASACRDAGNVIALTGIQPCRDASGSEAFPVTPSPTRPHGDQS